MEEFFVVFQILAELGQVSSMCFDFQDVSSLASSVRCLVMELRSREAMTPCGFYLGVAGRAGAHFDVSTADEGGEDHFRHGILADENCILLFDLNANFNLGPVRVLPDADQGRPAQPLC